jgi:hypothetical protein
MRYVLPRGRAIVPGAVPMRRRGQDEAARDELAELTALADGSLAPERRAALAARIAASGELADRLAEQERAVMLTRNAAAAVAAPTGLRERVAAQGARRRAVPQRLIGVGSAAAVVLAVVVAFVVLSTGTQSERFRAALAPTRLVPDAAGRATLTRTASGWRIEIAAAGLPRRDGGRFYEAWLRSPTGVLVPIGTFNDGRKVTLWAGVSPRAYPGLTVTREQADGNQASSGEKVLVGTARG